MGQAEAAAVTQKYSVLPIPARRNLEEEEEVITIDNNVYWE